MKIKLSLWPLAICSKVSQAIPNLAPMSISGCDIPFSQSVRNLGFYLDEMLSMDAHIKYLCRILFCQLRRIGKTRSFLPTDAANKLAVSLIHRIQYKIVCLCFVCIYQNSMPPYMSDLLHPYCPSRTLRSLGTSLLTVPRFSLETFWKRFLLFLDPLSGTHYHYP